MTTAVRQKSGFEKWQDGINRAVENPKWDVYDCEIRSAVNEYNYHLSKTAGYFPLDWQFIKAMIWVESGAESSAWKTKPIQIGIPGDPGLMSFLSGNEGGNLIIPPSMKNHLSTSVATSIPSYNIRAGIGYMLMRMANFEYKTIPDSDTKIYEVVVRAGDSLEKVAKANGSTTDMLRSLNQSAFCAAPGPGIKVSEGIYPESNYWVAIHHNQHDCSAL